MVAASHKGDPVIQFKFLKLKKRGLVSKHGDENSDATTQWWVDRAATMKAIA